MFSWAAVPTEVKNPPDAVIDPSKCPLLAPLASFNIVRIEQPGNEDGRYSGPRPYCVVIVCSIVSSYSLPNIDAMTFFRAFEKAAFGFRLANIARPFTVNSQKLDVLG